MIAELAGIRLDYQDVTQEYKRALVRHEYPGQDGADLDPQGWGPIEHRLRVVFLEERQADWKMLQSVLKNGSSMVLQHPEKGALTGYVESLSIRSDERIDTTEVDFTFVEDGIDVAPKFRPSAADVAASMYEPMARNAAEFAGASFYPAKAPTPDLTDPNWLEKLGDLGNKLNALVAAMKGELGRMDSIIVSFTSPVSAALLAIDFGADLPSQLTKRIATVFDLMQGKVDGAPSPAVSAAKYLRDSRTLADTFRGSSAEGAARALAASQGASTVARVMAGDEDRLRAMRAYEATQAFDAEGRWVGRGLQPSQLPATADQVAALVAQARSLIQEARPWVTDPADLDRLALALQEQYRSRLVEFEQLREIVVLTPTPLHVVCHQYGLPYNMAERLVLLNHIRNPSFVQGRILIYGS